MREPGDFHVSLRGITKVYGLAQGAAKDEAGNQRAAVDDVWLEIPHGTRLGIVGRNGAGKSTLVHIIAGIADQTWGDMHVRGHVTSVMTLGVGLREEMTGRDNIYVDGELQGKSREEIETFIDGIIAFAELGEFIDYPVRTYSTGMKSRLAFSMITHLDPEILVIDEALSAGDAKFSVKAGKKIREICDRGKIVILVSHSMGAIREMCDRCVWIEDGRVAMDGAPGEVTEAYVDAVHRADQELLLKRFRKLAGSATYKPGFEIRWMELIDAQSEAESASIERGSDATLRAGLVLPQDAVAPSVRLRVERIDGLLVVEQSHALEADGGAFPSIVEIAMRPMPFGPGTFHAQLALMSEDRVTATYSILFECFTRRELVGGRPALTHPVRIHAVKNEPVPTNAVPV